MLSFVHKAQCLLHCPLLGWTITENFTGLELDNVLGPSLMNTRGGGGLNQLKWTDVAQKGMVLNPERNKKH